MTSLKRILEIAAGIVLSAFLLDLLTFLVYL